MQYTTVYLGLGGNEGNVLICLKHALESLSQISEIHNLKNSHFYCTTSVDTESNAQFVNCVCSFETMLTIEELFAITQHVEHKFGKKHKPKYADRPIDIDIIFYGQTVCHNDILDIPHPKWHERLFVLVPLSDLIEEIWLGNACQHKHFYINDLIQYVCAQTDQSVCVLERNPLLI